MENLSLLPIGLSACTNVVALEEGTQECCISNTEFVECIMSARKNSMHTQPLPSDRRDVKKILARLDSFHSSQLNTFLYGYSYPNLSIPDKVLSAIRALCVNSDSDWAYCCQTVAFDLYCNELQARGNGMVPRPKPDDPVALPQLRSSLPTLSRVPKAVVRNCHFKYVGTFSNDPSVNEQIFKASVMVENQGSYPFTMDITQTHTVIDSVRVENGFIKTTLDKQELGGGEAISLNLCIAEPPRSGFTKFEQLLVLTIDGVLRYFITFTIVSPRQDSFGQGFPECLPLVVQNSSLGSYSAPMMLQILKHVFIKQKGLSSAAAVHLMIEKSNNYRLQNQEVMCEVLRGREILREQMNLSSVLDTFWLSQPDATKAPAARRFKPPVSAAQPAGYLPGIDIPTGNTSSSPAIFPNPSTKLPEYLTTAPPEVTMGLILLWLSTMRVDLLESYDSADSISFLEAMPPYLRGIIMWIIDLCCALLQNGAANGATERGLALTFANILVSKGGDVSQEDDTNTNAPCAPTASSIVAAVSRRQLVVTAFLYWLHVYNVRFEEEL